MTNSTAQRAEKSLARRRWVRQELAAHDSNIQLLTAFAQGHITLKGKGYTPGAENYRQTPEDKARLPRTLANLNLQRALLARELEVLLAYGA